MIALGGCLPTRRHFRRGTFSESGFPVQLDDDVLYRCAIVLVDTLFLAVISCFKNWAKKKKPRFGRRKSANILKQGRIWEDRTAERSRGAPRGGCPCSFLLSPLDSFSCVCYHEGAYTSKLFDTPMRDHSTSAGVVFTGSRGIWRRKATEALISRNLHNYPYI